MQSCYPARQAAGLEGHCVRRLPSEGRLHQIPRRRRRLQLQHVLSVVPDCAERSDTNITNHAATPEVLAKEGSIDM